MPNSPDNSPWEEEEVELDDLDMGSLSALFAERRRVAHDAPSRPLFADEDDDESLIEPAPVPVPASEGVYRPRPQFGSLADEQPPTFTAPDIFHPLSEDDVTPQPAPARRQRLREKLAQARAYDADQQTDAAASSVPDSAAVSTEPQETGPEPRPEPTPEQSQPQRRGLRGKISAARDSASNLVAEAKESLNEEQQADAEAATVPPSPVTESVTERPSQSKPKKLSLKEKLAQARAYDAGAPLDDHEEATGPVAELPSQGKPKKLSLKEKLAQARAHDSGELFDDPKETANTSTITASPTAAESVYRPQPQFGSLADDNQPPVLIDTDIFNPLSEDDLSSSSSQSLPPPRQSLREKIAQARAHDAGQTSETVPTPADETPPVFPPAELLPEPEAPEKLDLQGKRAQPRAYNTGQNLETAAPPATVPTPADETPPVFPPAELLPEPEAPEKLDLQGKRAQPRASAGNQPPTSATPSADEPFPTPEASEEPSLAVGGAQPPLEKPSKRLSLKEKIAQARAYAADPNSAAAARPQQPPTIPSPHAPTLQPTAEDRPESEPAKKLRLKEKLAQARAYTVGRSAREVAPAAIAQSVAPGEPTAPVFSAATAVNQGPFAGLRNKLAEARAAEATQPMAGVDVSPPSRVDRLREHFGGTSVVAAGPAPTAFEQLLTPLAGPELALLQQELEAEVPIFNQLQRTRGKAVLRQQAGLLMGLVVFVLFCWHVRLRYLTKFLPHLHNPRFFPTSWATGHIHTIVSGGLFCLGFILPLVMIAVVADAIAYAWRGVAELRPDDVIVAVLAGAAAIVIFISCINGYPVTAALVAIAWFCIRAVARQLTAWRDR